MKKVKIGDQIEYFTWSIPGRKATVKVIEICKHGEKEGRRKRIEKNLNTTLLSPIRRKRPTVIREVQYAFSNFG